MINTPMIKWYAHKINEVYSPCSVCNKAPVLSNYVVCNRCNMYMPIPEYDMCNCEFIDEIILIAELKLHHLVRIIGKCDFHENMANRHVEFQSFENVLKYLPIPNIGICI